MKINNKRELQNIAINHSTDIDYKDFMEIYRECAKDRFNFLTIDTTLPASNPLRFQKKFVRYFIKKTVTNQVNILNRKIKQNEAQYDF